MEEGGGAHLSFELEEITQITMHEYDIYSVWLDLSLLPTFPSMLIHTGVYMGGKKAI